MSQRNPFYGLLQQLLSTILPAKRVARPEDVAPTIAALERFLGSPSETAELPQSSPASPLRPTTTTQEVPLPVEEFGPTSTPDIPYPPDISYVPSYDPPEVGRMEEDILSYDPPTQRPKTPSSQPPPLKKKERPPPPRPAPQRSGITMLVPPPSNYFRPSRAQPTPYKTVARDGRPFPPVPESANPVYLRAATREILREIAREYGLPEAMMAKRIHSDLDLIEEVDRRLRARYWKIKP